MSESTVISAKQVLLRGKIQPATIVIREGKIESIESTQNNTYKEQPNIRFYEIPDDQVVLPGVVDSHVHVNEPGRTEWEGFETATRAAIIGGVTTIADMPLNSIPPTTSTINLDAKVQSAFGKCYTDVAFIGGVVHNNQPHLKELLEAGVVGFKCFLIHSGVDEFTHVNEEQLREALSHLQGGHGFLMYHAEVELHDHEFENIDGKQYKTFLDSRPKAMENQAIELVIKMCREFNVRSHIVHLSSGDAVPLIREAKKEGLPLTVETCYHYLYFDAEAIPPAQPKFKCCPPIRESSNREILWDALLEGVIDLVVSDHSPCTADLKAKNDGDYMASWGGISSLQFGLSIIHTEAIRRGHSLQDISRWLSEKPAELIGFSHRKGKIEVGYDADLLVFDPLKKVTIHNESIHFKNKVTAYEDQVLTGHVEKTFLRGRLVAEGGALVESIPKGNLLFVNKEDVPVTPIVEEKELLNRVFE